MVGFEEKNDHRLFGGDVHVSAKPEAEVTGTSIISDDVSSSADGDDALKMAGTHAHAFDEEYYRKLRNRIVRAFV